MELYTMASKVIIKEEKAKKEKCRFIYAKICKYDCRQKKKVQTSAKSIFQFFARLHFLTQIFAHSCNRCEASSE